MALMECSECKGQVSSKAESCPHCGAPGGDGKVKKRKKWYNRTSVTLCVAAGLVLIGFGFIHVITGVVSPYQLPFDIVLKESFGYSETFVDAEQINALPYNAAKIRYPLGCKALQRHNYMESGNVFEARMTRQLRENMKQWRREFERTLNLPERRWQDQLRERPQSGQIDPEDPNAYNSQGIAAARQGQYETALAAFTRAFQRDPVFADAYYNRGLVSVAIGLLGQGVSDFGKVAEIRPGSTEGYHTRGSLYFAMKQYDEAILDFTKIVELDPTAAEAIFQRSLACYAKGEYDRAWQDVYRIQSLGHVVPAEYLKVLRVVSTKEK